MPAPSSWLCRAAPRRVVLRALLGLAAFAGITTLHAGAPGAATLDTGQRQFSKAETLLWQTDHLANVRRSSRLRYRYTKTGTAEEQHTDVIDLEVLRVHPDGQKGVQVHYFTGKQEKPVPEQDPVTGNPVLAVYLQADVYAMNRRTEGGWRYFHRAIKTALAATNTVEPVSLDFHGRKVPASRVASPPMSAMPSACRSRPMPTRPMPSPSPRRSRASSMRSDRSCPSPMERPSSRRS